MTSQLGYGSYPASNRSEPAPEDSLHGGDNRLCLSGSGAWDRGRVRRPELICYGWGERIPRPDIARFEKLPDPQFFKLFLGFRGAEIDLE